MRSGYDVDISLLHLPIYIMRGYINLDLWRVVEMHYMDMT